MGDVIKFKTEDFNEQEALLNSVEDQEFDSLVMVGIKDGELYMAHTTFESRLKIIGALRGLEHFLWSKGDI